MGTGCEMVGADPSDPADMTQPADPTVTLESSAITASTSIGTVSVTNDDSSVTYGITYTGTHTFFRVYIDADQSPTKGFVVGGIKADFLLENGNLWRYTGSGTNWLWAAVTPVTFSNSGGVVSWRVLR